MITAASIDMAWPIIFFDDDRVAQYGIPLMEVLLGFELAFIKR